MFIKIAGTKCVAKWQDLPYKALQKHLRNMSFLPKSVDIYIYPKQLSKVFYDLLGSRPFKRSRLHYIEIAAWSKTESKIFF